MRGLVACVLLTGWCSLIWAEDDKTEAATPVEVSADNAKQAAPETKAGHDEAKVDGPLNIARICRELVCMDMGAGEWEKFIIKATQRYKQFEQEYDISNVKRFLDDRLIALAPRLLSGKGAALKEFCCWLALYDVYAEPVPHYIQSISETDKQWIKNELSDFDWGRTAEKIKDKARGAE